MSDTEQTSHRGQTAEHSRLEMRSVRRSFGATKALCGVDLTVAPGEVMALVGENGAGKSTLMKILSGAIPPDEGKMFLDGADYVPGNPLHARKSGVAMIYQELALAPQLSVMENILLGIEPTHGRTGQAVRVHYFQSRHPRYRGEISPV